MKLSALFITTLLSRSYRLSIPRDISAEPCLIRPSFIRSDIPPQDCVVYISNESTLSSFPIWDASFSNSLIIVLQEPTSQVHYRSPNIVTIQEEVNIAEVYLKVQEIFETYRQWKEKLIDSYLTDRSLQKLLEISAPVLNNTLFVTGMDFKIYARVNTSPVFASDTVLGASKSTARSVTKLKKSELFNQARLQDGAFYFPKHITGLASLGVNIKKKGRTTHRLVMLEDSRQIIEGEGFLLEYLASFIENLLNTVANIPPIHNRLLYDTFLTAITDRSADHISISQKLTSEGWLRNHSYQCVLIELSSLDIENEMHKPLMSYIANTFGINCAVLHQENILVFVNLSLSEFSSKELSSIVYSFAKTHHVQTGMSRVVAGHMSLRRQYLQALNALRIGRQKDRSTFVHLFDDVTMDYILQQATRSLPGDMICHSKLLLLEDSDHNRGTEYLKTLKIYLENQCNASQTAATLNIHRSTMLYRLEKIQQILQSDLKNPDELLHLALSFRLINFEERRQQHQGNE